MSASKESQKNNAQDEQQPLSPVTINVQYIKDLSFENPNPLKNFEHSDKAPEVNVNLELNAQQVAEHSYEVTLSIKVDSKRETNPIYIVELDYAGIFTLNNVPENTVHPFLMVQCPHFLFPFARNIIAQTTSSGGFQPFLLNPIDFAGLYQQKLREQTQTEETNKSKGSSK